MTVLSLLDSAGTRRSPATMPGYHAGRPPRNQGMRYPADPPTVEENVAVMRHVPDDRHGRRARPGEAPLCAARAAPAWQQQFSTGTERRLVVAPMEDGACGPTVAAL